MNQNLGTHLENVRVIGVYAHIDAGKTTTSEAILYLTGRIHRAGSVDEGSTQLDWMEQERKRGITITAAATTCSWKGCQIHLIDTPGHIDFTAEVVRSMRVIDGAVIVLCGVGGVETQTETVWRHADEKHLSRLIFVNKLDREFADFERVVAEVKERLTSEVVALQMPIYTEDRESSLNVKDRGDPGSAQDSNQHVKQARTSTGNGATVGMDSQDPGSVPGRPSENGQGRPRLIGVVDLLGNRALAWDGDGEEPVVMPIPAGLAVRVAEAREALLDAICETDEALLSQRLEGIEPALPALMVALRCATIAGRLTPVLCGSAKNCIGIQPLLDAIAGFLPSPLDMPVVVGHVPGGSQTAGRSAHPGEPFCATAFKIVTDPHVGRLAWVRVFSGMRQVGDLLYNPRTGEQERVGRIYAIHANHREHVGQMQAGDVVALVGAKSAITGDTLCDPAQPLLLESFRFPEPVISVALAPGEENGPLEQGRDRLQACAARLCEEDPTLLLSFDAETGEQILSGMGELHLEIAVDRLRSEYSLIARASPFRIAYRESVRHKSEATGVYRKQSGGHGHFAMVRLRVEPLERGAGIIFCNTASPVEVPEGFVRATESGAREALDRGVLAGYPLTDLRVTLLGGRFHEVDSNSLDFRIAGSMALRQAARQAGPVLLEPIMQADIQVDEERLGTVLADFGRRRGAVAELGLRGIGRFIRGEVPLAEARGYATVLRSMTHGRGTFTLEFRQYAPVPERLKEQIVEERAAQGKLAVR